MMQPRTIKAYITQIGDINNEFVEKMRALRDPKTLELPADFRNELYKWSLECKYTSVRMNPRLFVNIKKKIDETSLELISILLRYIFLYVFHAKV